MQELLGTVPIPVTLPISAFQGRDRHQRGELPDQLPLGLCHFHSAGLHG